MTLPITITATADDLYRAETPGGPVEATSLRELGDRLRDLLANLEDEFASDMAELARLSRSATDRATLLELARTYPPPDAWFGYGNDSRQNGPLAPRAPQIDAVARAGSRCGRKSSV